MKFEINSLEINKDVMIHPIMFTLDYGIYEVDAELWSPVFRAMVGISNAVCDSFGDNM